MDQVTDTYLLNRLTVGFRLGCIYVKPSLTWFQGRMCVYPKLRPVRLWVAVKFECVSNWKRVEILGQKARCDDSVDSETRQTANLDFLRPYGCWFELQELFVALFEIGLYTFCYLIETCLDNISWLFVESLKFDVVHTVQFYQQDSYIGIYLDWGWFSRDFCDRNLLFCKESARVYSCVQFCLFFRPDLCREYFNAVTTRMKQRWLRWEVVGHRLLCLVMKIKNFHRYRNLMALLRIFTAEDSKETLMILRCCFW